MQHGVHGYLLRGAGIEDLVQAIRTVGRGQRFLSPSVAQRMADSMARESLTERETEVLDLLAAGYGNKIIASLLGITAGTVKTHVQAVMGKLNAASRTQAVSIAMRRGMVAMERRALH
jgi:DNA-binding NarL/FixJ family response regulator